MKASSLMPQWAWLLVNDVKDIEDHSYATRVRERG